MTISFSVPGNPLPKQSFRVIKDGKRSGYTDPKVKAWQEVVSLYAAQAMAGEDLLEGEVHVEIAFYRDNRRKVDLDNLSKAVLDACNNIVWKDDKQVVSLLLEKYYSKDYPRVEVAVEDWEGVTNGI